MRLATWAQLDRLFARREVATVTLVRVPGGMWTFTVMACGGAIGVRAQRGGVRTWADPRVLVNTLTGRYGVSQGDFRIEDEENDDENDDTD